MIVPCKMCRIEFLFWFAVRGGGEIIVFFFFFFNCSDEIEM